MKTFEEALEIVMQSAFETKTETISFNNSCGRILAEDISSDIDMPPFNRSAVDGFACRRSDISEELGIVEIISAGKEPRMIVARDQCSKIMTGATVPDGCDFVFMIEDSVSLPSGKIRFKGVDAKTNISFKGEDVKAGDVVLRAGKFIKPQDIGVMASIGHINVLVKKMPAIGIISTGDELVEPSEYRRVSQIRNINAYLLLSQVTRAGGEGRYYGIAPDTEKETYQILQKAISENDIVLLTGGVSMGDYDFVPSVLQKAGVNILFDRINVQPGKPTTFGVHSKALVFGLPGNPVSSFVQFETLVRPVINKMMGHNWKIIEHILPMAIRYERERAERMGWIPVTISEKMEVAPVIYHGSAHISSLPYSDGIISIKPGKKFLEKGELVNVRLI
jgi:molybdopterin molybdotransferase